MHGKGVKTMDKEAAMLYFLVLAFISLWENPKKVKG
jgi:hypothetical protein